MKTRFVILKFGGTSVASRARWQAIADVTADRVREGFRPVVVCSALAGVSDALERLPEAARNGTHEPLVGSIEGRHLELAAELEVDPAETIAPHLAELKRLSLGVSLMGEVTPRVRARIMALGELIATKLGVAFLRAAGVSIEWLDARQHLTAMREPSRSPEHVILQATCIDDADERLAADLQAREARAFLTQGFIASDAEGTVLLGRGGSDTSAAYFAAKLGAERCEIWTDVPGAFTADPRLVAQARLIRSLDYDEAQELASTGARVLHPRCIAPLRRARIPLEIRWTERPSADHTSIAASGSEHSPKVKAISARSGVMLVSMETPGMWQQVGFLAEVFACFVRHGLSVDLVSTSEMNVTVSLDPAANALDTRTLEALLEDLSPFCSARLIGPCAAVSLVGRRIRAIVHQLGPALEAFEEQQVHLVSQAASDLNLTFVVDEDQARRLVQRLHGLLFEGRRDDPLLGPTHKELVAEATPLTPSAMPSPWWQERRDDLLQLARETPLYVYDAASLTAAADRLLGMKNVSAILYSIKANPHRGILERFAEMGLGFDCVSAAELDHLFDTLPRLDPARVLFTPNFAPRVEYREALAHGVVVTLDNLHPLSAWPDEFEGRDLFLRIDPGVGRGHHAHVRTAGAESKFGIAVDQLDEVSEVVDRIGARVVGLHAHAGSGIHGIDSWAEVAMTLANLTERFPDVGVLDLGGGLSVPERATQAGLDLRLVDESLARVRQARPDLALWLEPGRYLVATAGVLLARVTQLKSKRELTYVGVDTGMNSLIRPALYGAWHEIVNLSRLGEPATMTATVVGPICETGDTLGRGRRIAPAQEGDVLLIASTGAYGRSMSSRYNLREPAEERLLAERVPGPTEATSVEMGRGD